MNETQAQAVVQSHPVLNGDCTHEIEPAFLDLGDISIPPR